MRTLLLSLFACQLLAAPQSSTAPVRQEDEGGRRAAVLSNDRLELAVATQGGAMFRLILRDDPEKLSPYGNPERIAPQAGQRPARGAMGHFVCVDGFGPVSNEERAAGLGAHGEARAQPWEMVYAGKQGNVTRMTFLVKLPIVQQAFTRTFEIVDGESVIYVDSTLESLLGFDRPVNWAEHLTLGSPFLEPEKTLVDMSGRRARTRVHPQKPGPLPKRLVSEQDFIWPMAPALAGGLTDLRSVPSNPNSIDHAATLMDTTRRLSWVTALNTARGYLAGYMWRQEEYPWLQDWENYQPSLNMNRGLEFSTQPFDVPRREVIDLHTMFDAPVYRWLPAKSKIASRFLLFYVKMPAGMSRVDDVRLENGKIIVEDKGAGQRIVLSASLSL